MDKKLKAKWVKALRSGDFTQGEGRLYKAIEDSFCCLGVLENLEAVWKALADDLAAYLMSGIAKQVIGR